LSKGGNVTFDEIKALGPYHAAEVQISWKKKITRLVLVVGDDQNPSHDFPWRGGEFDDGDVDAMGRALIAEARAEGLVAQDAKTAIVNLDGLAKSAS
jgi:hypothetical protein